MSYERMCKNNEITILGESFNDRQYGVFFLITVEVPQWNPL